MAKLDALNLPAHFELEPELRELLSSRPGHQRCIEGRDEILLVVHEVPKAGVPERDALFFWRRHDGRWVQPGGPGLNEMSDLLARYERVIDDHEEVINSTNTASQIYGTLRHAGPIVRAIRNLVSALERAMVAEPEDRDLRTLRDRAKEVERAAELLENDARVTLEFWSAKQSEEQAVASQHLWHIAYRINLLAAFFLPLAAVGALLDMNIELPAFVRPLFWIIFTIGIVLGGLLLWWLGRRAERPAQMHELRGDIKRLAVRIGGKYKNR